MTNMSEHFKLFMTEFNATGRERGEGFSLSNLNSLTDSERREAEDLLMETIAEIRSVMALAGMRSDRAIPLLESLAKTAKGTYRVAIIHALWKLGVMTPESAEADLLRLLRTKDVQLQIYCIIYLREFASRKVINALLALIKESQSKEIIAHALSVLVQDICHFVDHDSFFSSIYRRMLLDIVGDDMELRKAALIRLDHEIEQYNVATDNNRVHTDAE
jgi:hypothetical protein